MLVAVAGQRDQRFDLADRLQPDAHRVAVMTTPAFRRERGVHAVEQRQIEDRDDEVASRLDELHDGAEPSDRMRCAHTFRRKLRDQPLRQRRLRRLALQPRRQCGKQLEIVERLLGAAENVSVRCLRSRRTTPNSIASTAISGDARPELFQNTSGGDEQQRHQQRDGQDPAARSVDSATPPSARALRAARRRPRFRRALRGLRADRADRAAPRCSAAAPGSSRRQRATTASDASAFSPMRVRAIDSSSNRLPGPNRSRSAA